MKIKNLLIATVAFGFMIANALGPKLLTYLSSTNDNPTAGEKYKTNAYLDLHNGFAQFQIGISMAQISGLTKCYASDPIPGEIVCNKDKEELLENIGNIYPMYSFLHGNLAGVTWHVLGQEKSEKMRKLLQSSLGPGTSPFDEKNICDWHGKNVHVFYDKEWGGASASVTIISRELQGLYQKYILPSFQPNDIPRRLYI